MKIKVSEGQFNRPPITEGTYDVVAKKMIRKEATSGNKVAYIQFEVLEGEFSGQNLLGMLVCIESVLWKFNQLYKAIAGEDMPGQDFENEDELLDWIWGEIDGVPLRVKATERMYQGEARMDLEYLPA